jgi:hypothetical protein
VKSGLNSPSSPGWSVSGSSRPAANPPPIL